MKAVLCVVLAGGAGRCVAEENVLTIRVRMLEGLRFDPPRFRVEPGTELRLEWINADSTEVAHNALVLDSPEARGEVVAAALALGPEGPAAAYVPESNRILAATRLLQAGERQTLALRMPDEAAVLPYVCTFPGHGQVMYGAIHVGKPLPELSADPDLPDVLRGDGGGVISRRPWVQRMFLPDAGPAAVAVALRGVEWNVCWDAGTCALRYVWQGGFLDCAQHWHSKGQPRAELLGRVIWKVDSASAIRVIGDDGASPSPSFRGYDLVNGEPRFSYRLGATLVSETLSGDPGTGGLRRTFVIENPGAPVWLEMPETAGFRREASAGIWEKEGLRVPEAEAGHFDVLLTAEEASGEK